MEGAASIHVDIHEAAPSELWEKASFAPTWNFCETSMLFRTSGYCMYSRDYVGPGEWEGFSSNVKQKLPGSIPPAKKRLRMIKEIITCPMYEPFTHTKTAVCARHGEVESNQLIPCEDSCWGMWSMLYWQGCHLEAFSVTSSSCPKSQGPRLGNKCWWAAGNPVDVRCHSPRYCPATDVSHV